MGEHHVVEQHAEVRLEHAELLLHGRGRETDLGPYHPGTGVDLGIGHPALHLVSGVDIGVADQVADR
ncbi:hypothetical protein [Saccharopolyspora shandongensis]|uniref:hypothetical protein n=1 Tax=Saccharopolyspora shandongensis TaxID=418495 RepID=UPI0033FEDB17